MKNRERWQNGLGLAEREEGEEELRRHATRKGRVKKADIHRGLFVAGSRAVVAGGDGTGAQTEGRGSAIW